MKNKTQKIATQSRRQFLSTTAIGVAAMFAGPAIIGAKEKEASKMIQGENGHKFEIIHNWAQLPDKYKWQTTHGVAVDKDNNLYVMHMGDEKKAVQPTIFVFDADGKFIRAFGEEFHGGGHGIDIRREGNEEFIYACSYKQVKGYSKMTLKGETIWNHHAPMESKVYGPNEDKNKSAAKGRDKFQPTNFAFMPDGGFLLADGYGSYYVHRFDKDGKYLSTFGGAANGKDGKAKFDCPHGIWIDNRPGREPTMVVTDRANDQLQILDMEANYKETLPGFGMPANIDTWKDIMLVPELKACVTLLDGKNEVVARIGEDKERVGKDAKLRAKPKEWQDGKFVHPHDACFDPAGNIYVAEWVTTGRITKLKRLS